MDSDDAVFVEEIFLQKNRIISGDCMKKIKVKYIGWWDGFQAERYSIHEILGKHYEIELSDEPEYVFCSVYTNEYLEYDCLRIFYTGENVCPDFNLFDYAIGFEYLTFGDRYIRIPNYLMNPKYDLDIERMLNKHEDVDVHTHEKTEFCDFIYSNNNADRIRQECYTKLNGYKKVNSGGKFMNNTCHPNGVPDKYEFQKKHKFSIAFENSSHYGYTTEKLIQSFAARTIPIYWGDPGVTSVFNSKAMINVHDYGSLDEVLDRVIEVDNNSELYKRMLSEPAMLRPDELSIQYNDLENYLIRIFSQPLELAKRRNESQWVKNYYNMMQTRANTKSVLNKIKTLIRKRMHG